MFINYPKLHRTFLRSSRPHILMISNHGIHQWKVIPGLPDTGGQNIFVNRFTNELAHLGFRVSIVNRGGYTHPVTGEKRHGIYYKDARQRILYLEDNLATFIRKEDMAKQIPQLATNLQTYLKTENMPITLIISHYWDGAVLGINYNQQQTVPIKHIWIPHSLGSLKKGNVAPDQWQDLNIDERIDIEQKITKQVDGITATSRAIQTALEEDYAYTGPMHFLPPCVDIERYHPRTISNEDPIWAYLCERTGLRLIEVQKCHIITEISRTDKTKRKEVLIKAFARVQEEVPQSILVIAIDERQQPLASNLLKLIEELGLKQHIAVVGSISEWLPKLYAITTVYCTPSVMEGFGMSAQEAAATGIPVVASHLVPFATEYLLNNNETSSISKNDTQLQIGKGAIVVQADDIDGFARALTHLLTHKDLRDTMKKQARTITVPYFTWQSRVPAFLNAIGESIDSNTKTLNRKEI